MIRLGLLKRGGATSPTLATLTLSPLTATAGAGYSGTIAGATGGSTIAATSSDGTVLTVVGTTVTGTFSGAGTPTITLTETLAGASNSPNASPQAMTVAAAVSLTIASQPTANSVLQRTSSTGGGYGKGQGKAALSVTVGSATPLWARTRSSGAGNPIVQAAFLASASHAGGAISVTGLDVPDVVTNPLHGAFYVDVAPTATGPWTNGTNAIMLGDVTALAYSQSHGEAFITPKEGTNAISQGITPSNYGWTYGNTTFVTGAATWAKPTTPASLTTVNSAGVMTFLNGRIASRGVACAVLFYAIGSKTISDMAGSPYNTNLKTILTATCGTGASSTGFHEVMIMIGHNDSLNCAGPKTFQGLLEYARNDLTGVNNYASTVKWLVYTIPASNVSTSPSTQGRHVDVAAVRDGARAWCAVDPTNRSYIQVEDAALTDGCHPVNAGNVTVARAMLRAGTNIGPSITSASRVAKDITLTIAHNLGSSLVGTGNWWIRFLVTSADVLAGGKDWSSKFTISSGTIIDATHIKLTLTTDPGDGHVLSVRAFPLIDVTNTPGTDILRDNYDPEGYGYGRAIEFTGRTAVNVPLITGTTVNAPDTGWVAPASIRGMTMTSASYTAESGFGQGLNGGYGVCAGKIQFPSSGLTMECWIDAPSTPAATQYIIALSSNNFRIDENTAGKIESGGGFTATAGGTALTAGTRYHLAFVSDANGQRIYVNGTLTSPANSTNLALTSIIAPATPSLRNNAGNNFLFAGTLYEVLIRESAIYTSNFTAPTTPYAASPADAIGHWRLSGDGTELALAA